MRFARAHSLLLAAALAGCSLDTSVGPDAVDPAADTYAANLDISIPTMTKTTSGLYYKDLTVGSGVAVAATDSISVFYTGYRPHDGVAFATNVGGTAVGVRLGSPVNVPRFDEAVAGMKVGGTRRIVIPSQLAFGNGPLIDSFGRVVVPANSNVVYDIQVVGILK